jgi:hypothetical protein
MLQMTEFSTMRHSKRFVYALALTAIVGGILIVGSAIFAPDAMVAYITKPYWLLVFVLAYFLAPVVGRYIKLP